MDLNPSILVISLLFPGRWLAHSILDLEGYFKLPAPLALAPSPPFGHIPD